MVVEVAAAAVVVTTGKLTFLVGQYLFPFFGNEFFQKRKRYCFVINKNKLVT